MKEKFNLGIEISEKVLRTGTPHKIKRYNTVAGNRKIIQTEAAKSKIYRYRPGVNSSMIGDLDV